MNIYLICNNMLSSNINFEKSMDIEEKKKLRTLSLEGVILAKRLNLSDVANIYSSTYTSSIETAKYLSEKSLLNINLRKQLNDCTVGNLKNQSLKMLSYFQEHDFNYKLPGGESLNECGNRIESVINEIKKEEENVAIFLPRRALFSYLIKFAEHGFNLDERLALTKNDKVLMDSSEDAIEIFELSWGEDEVDINKISIGD